GARRRARSWSCLRECGAAAARTLRHRSCFLRTAATGGGWHVLRRGVAGPQLRGRDDARHGPGRGSRPADGPAERAAHAASAREGHGERARHGRRPARRDGGRGAIGDGRRPAPSQALRRMEAGLAQPARLGPDDAGPLFRDAFPGRRLVVVTNREPYEHRRRGDEIVVSRPAGGITSALDPLLQAVGGVWIAWGSGNADAAVADSAGRGRVPAEAPRYTLRRIWLDRADIRHYYLGFANQFLWPLCHLRPNLTRVRAVDWDRYGRVNRRFARAVLEEARDGKAAIWFHDYHLALAPGIVRAEAPGAALAHFWHIPWPPLEIFRVAPQAADLLEGLLANDLIGLHVPQFVENFLRCAQEILGAEVDLERGTAMHRGRVAHVRAFPISIDVEEFERNATRDGADAECARIRARYAPRGGQFGIGVDRMDYSKGLPEKLQALNLLWE